MPNPEDQLEQKQPEGEKPLGPNGESALRKERERADELEKQLKALQAQFGDIARAFGVSLSTADRWVKDAQDWHREG